MAEREVLATITDVRLRIRELVEQLADRDVLESLLAYIAELEDRLSVYEALSEPKDMRIPWDSVEPEVGLVK